MNFTLPSLSHARSEWLTVSKQLTPGPNECRHYLFQPATRGIEQHVGVQDSHPQGGIPSANQLLHAPGFALYRALLRQIPHISLPGDLTSRPDWINPITHLIQHGFRRNKNDTSPRIVTSALQSGYRFLALLNRAQDTSSASHAEVLFFLRERQKAFPQPRAPQVAAPPKPRPPPLLTRVSEPGQRPVYKATVRPLPLSQLSGGTRKVPVFEDAQGVPTLRLGKPESHSHANFLKHKAMRRQLRITALQSLWEERRREASEEDAWEATVQALAVGEEVKLADEDDENDTAKKGTSHHNYSQKRQPGLYEVTVREFGYDYLSAKLREEMVDMQARATALLDLRDEEQRLADIENEEKKQRKRAAREERVKLRKDTRSPDKAPMSRHPAKEHKNIRMPKSADEPSHSLSKDDWTDEYA